jgi:hypothetical protein
LAAILQPESAFYSAECILYSLPFAEIFTRRWFFLIFWQSNLAILAKLAALDSYCAQVAVWDWFFTIKPIAGCEVKRGFVYLQLNCYSFSQIDRPLYATALV